MCATATWKHWSRIFDNHCALFEQKFSLFIMVTTLYHRLFDLCIVLFVLSSFQGGIGTRRNHCRDTTPTKKDNSVVFSVNTCPNTFSRKSCLTSNPDRSTTASPRVNRSQRKNHRLSLELPSFKVISPPPRGFLSTTRFFPTFERNSPPRRDSDHPPPSSKRFTTPSFSKVSFLRVSNFFSLFFVGHG